MDNKGRAALVTGSSRGIGAGIVKMMAEEGYSYIGIVCSKDVENAQKTLEEVRALGAEAEVFVGDVSHKEDAERIVKDFIKRFGKIDVLVNNAGGALTVPPGKFDEMPLEYWDSQVALNLSAAAYCSHFALQDMKAKGTKGVIINTSSIMAWGGWNARKMFPYSPAKRGLNEFAEALGNECAPYGIRVNNVAPGFIITPRTLCRYTDEERARALEKIPIGRFGEPKDIANAVIFLADNDKAGFIVGQTLLVDGGQKGDVEREV